jgi:glutaminyl-peptide cyclotransferase
MQAAGCDRKAAERPHSKVTRELRHSSIIVLRMAQMIGRCIAASRILGIILLFVFASLLAFSDTQPTPTLGYVVVARYPHSTASYTEGFFYLDGLFYEGTGREGHSALLAIQPETGKALRKVALAQEYFDEGIVDWGPYIYEWTWSSQVSFVYERASFRLVKKLSYGGEGWGMTRTGDQIVTSDGSANLGFAIRRRFGWCGQSRFTMGLLW